MPLFQYRAKTPSGSLVRNYLVARTLEEASELLSSQGLEPLSLDRVREVGTPRSQGVTPP